MNFQPIVQYPLRFRRAFRLSSYKRNEIDSKIQNHKEVNKIKSGMLDRWVEYWKNAYQDYRNTFINAAEDCKKHPVRTAIYTTILGSCFYSNRHNPDETTFREQLINSNLKLILVGEPIQNPVSVQHVKWLEQCYNEGIIRRLNLGILSLIWLDNYDKDCFSYKAVCSYLKPRYITFYERIVDIGFFDKWWILERQMQDYDINEAEFSVIKIVDNVDTVSVT